MLKLKRIEDRIMLKSKTRYSAALSIQILMLEMFGPFLDAKIVCYTGCHRKKVLFREDLRRAKEYFFLGHPV